MKPALFLSIIFTASLVAACSGPSGAGYMPSTSPTTPTPTASSMPTSTPMVSPTPGVVTVEPTSITLSKSHSTAELKVTQANWSGQMGLASNCPPNGYNPKKWSGPTATIHIRFRDPQQWPKPSCGIVIQTESTPHQQGVKVTVWTAPSATPAL